MRDTAKKTPELRFSGFCGDWEQRKLGELLINLESGVSVNSSEEKTGYYILKTSAIKSGQVDLTEVKSILREEITRAKISIVKNSIIISRMNTPALVGDSALVTENRENIFLPDRLWQGRINNNFSPDWVIQSLNSSSSLRKIQNLATGTSGSMKNISKKFMLDFELKVPKLAEQAKIGSFFKQLDQLIALHQQKLDQLELMKKGFLQQLFPENGEKIPKVRFANFEDEWEQRKLGDLVNITTGKLDANAMVKNGQYDFYTSGIKKYKINTPAFKGPAITIAGNGATIGYMHLADGRFNAYQRTYVLTDFNDDRQFIFSSIGNNLPHKIAQEARTGNIPYIVMDVLSELKLHICELEEQHRIGTLFKNLDKQITLHQQKIEKLKSIKKALLQKMFI